jgi:hypothetical protein
VARHMEEIDSRLAKVWTWKSMPSICMLMFWQFTRNPRKEVTSLRDALHKVSLVVATRRQCNWSFDQIINNFAEESKKANNLLEKVSSTLYWPLLDWCTITGHWNFWAGSCMLYLHRFHAGTCYVRWLCV